MRKVLFTLLMVPMIICAQGLKITTITPTIICPGDSLHISVKFTPGHSTQIKLLGKEQGMNWGYDSTYIANNWPMTTSTTGNIYTLNIKTATYIGMGWATVRTMAVDTVHTIDAACGTAGIQEYAPATIEPEYYDVYGNRVMHPRTNEMLIDRRAHTKVIIGE